MGIHLNGDKIATEKPTAKNENKQPEVEPLGDDCAECSGSGLLEHGAKICTKCAGSGKIK